MRVAIIGAGVVGVATAHELAVAGHEVTVFDRQSSVACEGSFAHAGLLTDGLDAAWMACVQPRWQAAHLLSPWSTRWLMRHSKLSRTGAAREAARRLSQLSRERLDVLTRTLRLDFEQRDGALMPLTTEKVFRRAEQALNAQAGETTAFRLLDADQARAAEPALNPGAALRGALQWPQRAVGNCRQFTQLLKTAAQQRGARFVFQAEVVALTPQARPEIRLSAGEGLSFDAVVVSAGAGSAALLQRAGRRLPLMPVYGYSLTAAIRHVDGQPDNGPASAVIDTEFGVAITRLGQRLRVAGLADLGRPSAAREQRAMKSLYAALDRWFPGAAARQAVQHWKGARPMLPDGLPAIGESGLQGIWLNTGHGASAWSWATGSAALLSAQLAGDPPPSDSAPYSPARWR